MPPFFSPFGGAAPPAGGDAGAAMLSMANFFDFMMRSATTANADGGGAATYGGMPMFMPPPFFAFPPGMAGGVAGGGAGGGGGGVYGDAVHGEAAFNQILNQLYAAHAHNSGPPPASAEARESLPLVPVTQAHVDEKLECSICKCDFEVDEKVSQMPCEHLFHPQCITTWLEQRNTCPICRHALPAGPRRP